MVQVHCPKCRSLLVVDDALAWSVLTCPDCDALVRVPGPDAPAMHVDHLEIIEDDDSHAPPSSGKRMKDTANVRLLAQGKWGAAELITYPIRVDGKKVGDATIKEGFDLVVLLSTGAHMVEIGDSDHEVDIPEAGRYEVEFEFSRTWGKYSIPPTVRRINADGRSAAQRAREPIDLDRVDAGGEDSEVLVELDALEKSKPGWSGAILILVISLLLFMGAAQAEQIWDNILALVAVLAFHELGHFVTMRVFGYRNVRMFFIPFFGAAVSGRHYNVAGWKKAVVALAGPVPGIVLGMPAAVVGLILQEPLVIEVALLMLFLNGFNLLPFLPLDGGWVIHAVLFVRHPLLDVVFRVGAALCLLGVAIAVAGWCIGIMAVLMLLAIPMAYRQASIAYRLRQEGLVVRSLDSDSIPAEAALQILAELRKSLPQNTPPKVLAQHVATIFEAFNAEPPGVFVSLGLLAVQAGCFLAALVMSAVLSLMQNPPGGN